MTETILIVDDDSSILTALRMIFEEDQSVITAREGSEGLSLALEQKPDLILLDIGLPDMSGMDVLEKLSASCPETVVIMITAVDEVRTVVKALKLGAHDYLAKPLDAQEVKVTVKNALENKRLKDQIRLIQQPNVERYRFDMIGQSPQVCHLVEVARKVAQSIETPVLILGESGTGKGVLARTIHYSSSTLPGPFVTVNCTAITHELFESELFGYDRGAFTGATPDGKKGRFEEASGGTIFLDEIGSMTLVDQAKLLGVLEDRKLYRVGGKKPITISSRIIAASNVNLAKAVELGEFRKDLFFRLNVVKLEVPPLLERQEDILLLAEYFIAHYNRKFRKKFKRISTETKKILLRYTWPGNVRELRNTIERILLLEEGDVLLPAHIAGLESATTLSSPAPMVFPPEGMDYDEVIKTMIQSALKRTQGNVLEAARLLNMPPHKMRYRIKKYELKT